MSCILGWGLVTEASRRGCSPWGCIAAALVLEIVKVCAPKTHVWELLEDAPVRPEGLKAQKVQSHAADDSNSYMIAAT